MLKKQIIAKPSALVRIGLPDLLARITRHIPAKQFRRYLIVGGVNTAIGYGTYALLTGVFDALTPHGYVLAGVIATLLNVSVSYLNYKWFIFRTKGNYLREWIRCVAVYSVGILVVAASLPVLVFAIRRYANVVAAAPYIAGALLTGVNVVLSFLGHKNFSFRPQNSAETASDDRSSAAAAGHH